MIIMLLGGGMLAIRKLGHVRGGNRCGEDTLCRVTMTCWLMGLWSTQAKVEGMLKAAWHWSSNSSVMNSLLGEAVCTPLYVGLASTKVCVSSPFHCRVA